MTEETTNDQPEELEPEAAEEPAAEAAVPEEAQEEAPPVEPAPEAEAAEGAETAAEGEAEPAPAEEEEPTPPAPAKRKRKRVPRPERRQRPKLKRERPKQRKPIVRLPKPEGERGRRQERRGIVVSNAMDKTIVVRVELLKMHPRYKKVVRRARTFHAHDERNEANVGDVVRIVETRPLAKTKRWRLAEIVEAAR